LTSADANTRLLALRAARRRRDLKVLRSGLDDLENRHLAALYLGQVGDRDSIPRIRRLLQAAEPLARANAARALGVLRASDATDELMELAECDPELFVRRWATGAVGRLGTDRMVGRLAALLEDRDRGLWASAVFALGTIGTESACAVLRGVRDREPWFHFNRRRHIARALQGCHRTD